MCEPFVGRTSELEQVVVGATDFVESASNLMVALPSTQVFTAVEFFFMIADTSPPFANTLSMISVKIGGCTSTPSNCHKEGGRGRNKGVYDK